MTSTPGTSPCDGGRGSALLNVAGVGSHRLVTGEVGRMTTFGDVVSKSRAARPALLSRCLLLLSFHMRNDLRQIALSPL